MRSITAADLRGLARPTPLQQVGFIDHLCFAHSWYKHLPLDRGGEFVVFLSDREQRFARGTSLAHCREACGTLAYGWRTEPDRPFDLDFGDPFEVSADLRERCAFTLFPFCSNDLAAQECLLSLYGSLEPPHPLAAFLGAEAAADRAWQILPDRLRNALATDQDLQPADHALAVPFVETRRRADSLFEALRAPEIAKIERAIAGLLGLAA